MAQQEIQYDMQRILTAGVESLAAEFSELHSPPKEVTPPKLPILSKKRSRFDDDVQGTLDAIAGAFRRRLRRDLADATSAGTDKQPSVDARDPREYRIIFNPNVDYIDP